VRLFSFHSVFFFSILIFLLPASGLLAQTDLPKYDWTKSDPASAGLSGAKLQAMSTAVRSDQFKKIGSILIARHGNLVFEDYVDGDASTLRDTRSATKSITDILVGIAIREGKLPGVDAKILTLLPERAQKMQNPDPRKSAITVEDFLTMSSVLECDDWNDASRGNEERMYVIEDWAQFVLDLPIRGHMHVGEQIEPPKYGRYFSYCTGGAFVLSEVLQKVTGMRTDRYAQEKLFSPLGINNLQWVYSPLNVPQTGGGLRMTSQDLLKIGQLYLNNGQWHGAEIVSKDWVQRSTTAHAQVDDDTDYGYFWWLVTYKSGGTSYPAYFMSGNGGNKVYVVPSADLVAVITSTNYNTKGMHEQAQKLLTDYILASLQ
jgi:CubicO group peptidase (beta-lactamase class C family)